MAYNKKGYLQRAKMIQELAAQYYEPENHAKCYKAVWKRHIFPQFGICYNTFLNYLKVEIKPGKVLKGKTGREHLPEGNNTVTGNLNGF